MPRLVSVHMFAVQGMPLRDPFGLDADLFLMSFTWFTWICKGRDVSASSLLDHDMHWLNVQAN